MTVLVTRAVTGATRFAERAGPAPARAAGAIARRLHELGYYHRDFHPGNILVRETGDVVLIDLQKMLRIGVVPEVLRARDLAFFVHDMAERPDATELREAFL